MRPAWVQWGREAELSRPRRGHSVLLLLARSPPLHLGFSRRGGMGAQSQGAFGNVW